VSDDRPWYREPETFISFAALIVSLSAMVVGLYEASLQRAHDRAEVWPHVELATLTNPQGATVILENGGLGPAIIKTVAVTVDGRHRRSWPDALQALLGALPADYNNRTVVDHALRSGEQVTVVALGTKDLPKQFWPTVQRVRVTVCYASIFGDYWELSARLGASNYWRSVDGCPAQPRDTAF
jgi:hypothetical protein